MASDKHRSLRTRSELLFWRFVDDIRQGSMLEWLAVVATVGAIIYFLDQQGWRWQAWLLVPFMCAIGWLAVTLLYDMWFGGRK